MRYDVKNDCLHFKGTVPCDYHKRYSKRCKCEYYRKMKMRILIIKLGAAGDVIRSTPILRRLKNLYPDSEITWITYTPELLPLNLVDVPLMMDSGGMIRVQAERFDMAYNFDKDPEACALMRLVSAKKKKGFTLRYGKCWPIDKDAEHKFLTGIDDDLMKKNKKSYPVELFEMAGLSFNQEKYAINKGYFEKDIPGLSGYPIIGLNTGCGARWRKRAWPQKNWVELAKRLKKDRLDVLLLGGEGEDKLNRAIAKESGAVYAGHFPLLDFVGLVNKCHAVVTTVTMALHIAIALEKRIALINNLFNRSEFELYNLGQIIEPDVECLACYKGECEEECMEKISVDTVYSAVAGSPLNKK